MLTQIADNIYRKVVPLPNNPLREINAYIITGEKNLLIDTGFNRPECEEALRNAFDELGIEKTDVFITHLHSDHCGLVPKFAKEESIIYSGETDGELMNFEAGNLYWKILDDMFLKFGFLAGLCVPSLRGNFAFRSPARFAQSRRSLAAPPNLICERGETTPRLSLKF